MGLGLLIVVPLHFFDLARELIRDDLAAQSGRGWLDLTSQILDWYLWLLVLPLIWGVARRFPFERKGSLRWLAINLVLGLGISVLYSVLSLAKNQLIINIGSKDPGFIDLMRSWPSYFLASIEFFLVVYFAIVAGMHAVQYYEKLNARELNTSQLKMQLAEAKLDALRMQLHPHFLFNTLNAISSLMRKDPDAADGMISRLSDLLRLSLDHDDRHVIPLREELAFLDRYVSIEMVRFRDRLEVDVDVEPRCLDAQVPKLILQPLVENAIRHGTARSSRPGKVRVIGNARDGRLELRVVDNGPGLPANRPLLEGVGLANTRARLTQLYARDHRFHPGNASEGSGFAVELEIPLEYEERMVSGSFPRPSAA